MMRKFKIMTYNIHSGIGRDRRYRLDRIIEVIAGENPEVVALQEVDNNLRRTKFDHQSKIIGNALGMDYHHCVNRYSEGGEFGITTLSRFPIHSRQRHDLSFRARMEPRGSLRTDLHGGDSIRLHIFNVHLGLNARERQHQRRRLLSASILLDQTLQDPIVVLGDFNDRVLSVVHPAFRKHFADTFSLAGRGDGATFVWGRIKLRLDHIYICQQLKALDAYVVRNPLSQVASDHLPLVAIVKVKL